MSYGEFSGFVTVSDLPPYRSYYVYAVGISFGQTAQFQYSKTRIDLVGFAVHSERTFINEGDVTFDSTNLRITNGATVTLNGYLIPEEFNKVVTTQKQLTPKRVLINDNVGIDLTAIAGDTKDVRISVARDGA